MKRPSFLVSAALVAGFFSQAALADPINIVAAENFYGDIAAQIGGSNVKVTSILSNPDEDPHLFEASASTAKALVEAHIVISNGVDYDPWIEKLLSTNKADHRVVIVAAKLAGKKAGDNPHLWYNPATMAAVATQLSADLVRIDPAHKADYDKNSAAFVASLKPLNDKISVLQKIYSGTPVSASEPVFGYMAGLIGLKVHNEKFALAVMNNTEPSASEVGGFERDLRDHKVKAMLYNAQASDPAVQRLVQLAKDQKVPIVGVSETEPHNMTYQEWMISQLDALDKALSAKTE
jgi:zinc/manganese transport system substrate-binding protein